MPQPAALAALKGLGMALPHAEWCGTTIEALELRAGQRRARVPLPAAWWWIDLGLTPGWRSKPSRAALRSGRTRAPSWAMFPGIAREVRLHAIGSQREEQATVHARVVVAADGLGGGSLQAMGDVRHVAESSHLGAGAYGHGARLRTPAGDDRHARRPARLRRHSGRQHRGMERRCGPLTRHGSRARRYASAIVSISQSLRPGIGQPRR